MDLVLYNARFPLLKDNSPSMTAVAIAGDRIIELGDSAELRRQYNNARQQDMQGRLILPGLTDAHMHFAQYARNLDIVDCETATLQECLERVEQGSRITPTGQWILGHGWNQNRWQEGFGNAEMLDRVAPGHPVYLSAKSLHAGWANNLALKLAGIDLHTPDPPNGRINHDAQGQPDGILLEDAVLLVTRIIPEENLEGLVSRLKNAQLTLWKMGLTGIHDFDGPDCFAALQILCERDQLHLRVVKSIPQVNLEHAITLGLRSGFGDDLLQIGSLKLFADGALGPHTAAMHEPFIDDTRNYGILAMDKEQLFENGCRAVENGISLAVHAIGDRANHEVLDGFVQLREHEKLKNLPNYRHRVEHVQLLLSEDESRLAELNLIASMQPIHATSDMEMAERSWGSRNRHAYAWKTQLSQGARLAFGSDAPVEDPNPFKGIHAAVTRRRADGSPGENGWYPEQRLSLVEALNGFTQGPAYAAGMEDRLGKLGSGYLADLIVLGQDPFDCPSSDLAALKPLATMVGGKWVWEDWN